MVEDEGPQQIEEENLLEIEKNILTADLNLVNMKINEILHILARFNTIQAKKSRVEYKVELKNLFCRFYGYNPDLMEYLMKLFNPHECQSFLESMDTPRPLTIRLNTIKTRKQELIKNLSSRGVNLEPLEEHFKVGLKINSTKVPVGATSEYLAGHYMLQSASSWLPVMALAPKKGDYVLDMAAAPGGKTSHIAQIMGNEGVIVANDLKKERTKALFYNLQRLGIKNAIVTNYDGRKFPSTLKNFDRVLLDAPCTGLGVISRDPSIKSNRTMRDIYRAGHLQRELLRAAIDHCKPGGYIVYSTCSIAVEENESVVDYVVKNRHVKIMDTGINIDSKIYTKFGENRFHDRIKYCIRVFPHMHNLDGFFICKLKKLRDGVKGQEENEEKAKTELSNKNKTEAKLKKKLKKKKQKLNEMLLKQENETKNQSAENEQKEIQEEVQPTEQVKENESVPEPEVESEPCPKDELETKPEVKKVAKALPKKEELQTETEDKKKEGKNRKIIKVRLKKKKIIKKK